MKDAALLVLEWGKCDGTTQGRALVAASRRGADGEVRAAERGKAVDLFVKERSTFANIYNVGPRPQVLSLNTLGAGKRV